MIAISSECLLFQLTSGEIVPCLPEMVSVELIGDSTGALDPEVLRHAAASVFHYFKKELNRETVTVVEFAGALQKVLRKLGLSLHAENFEPEPPQTVTSDLGIFALESDGCLELFFFPRLRDELRTRLRQSPRLLRFRGLRGCVKQLAGARRWSARCEMMQEQIVEFLRGCLTAEPEQPGCALVVE
jgi:hypothetical protein